ncbi:hypothetical protein [Mycobacterium sp.]|uniref:hypothetical protein n=1 Tax=Mycobacterium sp. TaxID=1785 RepID=UPI003BB0F2C1
MTEEHVQDAAEPTEEQLRSAEAMRYRTRLRESEESNAELIRTLAESNARIEALERTTAETHLRGKLNDPRDMWLETKLEDLRDDTGLLSTDKLNARADELLESHPHWRAPAYSTPAGLVNSKGIIGGRPRNVLDADNVQPETSRGWAGFLQDAARGETRPPT